MLSHPMLSAPAWDGGCARHRDRCAARWISTSTQPCPTRGRLILRPDRPMCAASCVAFVGSKAGRNLTSSSWSNAALLTFEPAADPLHRFTHIGGGTGVTE